MPRTQPRYADASQRNQMVIRIGGGERAGGNCLDTRHLCREADEIFGYGSEDLGFPLGKANGSDP